LIMEDSFSPPNFDEDQAVPLEVAAGTLIIIHVALPHYSAPNRSQKSRYAYTLHAISGTAAYPEDNWLQRDQDLPLRCLTSISR
ncbi:phytanoyl-CoA dioxygenase family protein, partial [Arenicellales bacterium IMCC56312]